MFVQHDINVHTCHSHCLTLLPAFLPSPTLVKHLTDGTHAHTPARSFVVFYTISSVLFRAFWDFAGSLPHTLILWMGQHTAAHWTVLFSLGSAFHRLRRMDLFCCFTAACRYCLPPLTFLPLPAFMAWQQHGWLITFLFLLF